MGKAMDQPNRKPLCSGAASAQLARARAVAANWVICGIGCVYLAGCTHEAQTRSQNASVSDPASMSDHSAEVTQAIPLRANRLAQTMAEAEAAYTAGDIERLARLVADLQASGVRPHTQSDDDIIAIWATATQDKRVPYRGRLLGPAYVRGALQPGEVWRSAQTFKSGEPSTLAVSHQGLGPVRITVSDAASRMVCGPAQASAPVCRFTPLYTQRYNIELINEGPQRAVYFLILD